MIQGGVLYSIGNMEDLAVFRYSGIIIIYFFVVVVFVRNIMTHNMNIVHVLACLANLFFFNFFKNVFIVASLLGVTLTCLIFPQFTQINRGSRRPTCRTHTVSSDGNRESSRGRTISAGGEAWRSCWAAAKDGGLSSLKETARWGVQEGAVIFVTNPSESLPYTHMHIYTAR